jgi:outer membrane protein OmpA-like peptidoglycan-associated protein
MKKLLALLLTTSSVFGLLLTAKTADASLRQYKADVEESVWYAEDPNRLECTLNHQNPGYGMASFTSYASKTLNMEFNLDMLRLPKTYGVAAVYSVPPKWMPGKMHKSIADMKIRKQFDGDLPEKAAWTMLSELEKGFWPTLYYQDWYSQYDQVAVALNASNFKIPYEAFVNCVSNLLPYSFDDIKYTVLTYKFGGTELTKASKRKLDMIGAYLQEDPELELVLVDGYTDSYGGRSKNMQVSIQRAEEIKTYFSDLGVDANRIDVTGHGERRHAAPNTTSGNRAKNRRVVVRMAKA